MTVPYDRQTIDSPNPLARLAHRARTASALDAATAVAPREAPVLDFGCGPGSFLRELGAVRPDLTLLGYDPFFPEGPPAGVDLVDNTDDLRSSSLGLLTAFETCEHLTDDELEGFLDLAERTLRHDGAMLLSVPIIGGPTLLLKELNRVVLFRRRSDYRLRDLLDASLRARPATRAENVKTSHKGFDHRALRHRVTSRFALEREFLSPFPSLTWTLNSQHFSVWRRHGA